MALDTATLAIRLTLQGAQGVLAGVRGVGDGFLSMTHVLGAVNQHAFYVIENLKNIVAAGRNAADAMNKNLITPNADFETATQQFEQLLGSVDAAKQRIGELYQYANETPFLNPDVLKAGKLLQAFGGEALGMGKNLRMVGDMAAYANIDMAEMAFWVGRAYSAIQSGKPFGEAAMRLQELAVLSGEERDRLEEMQKSGATGAEVWDQFAATMQKTAGTTARLGETFTGMKSTLEGQWQEIKRLIGQPLFEAVKNDARGIRDDIQKAFDSGTVDLWARKAGDELTKLYEAGKKNSIFGLGLADLQAAAESGTLFRTIGTALEDSLHNAFAGLVNTIQRYGPDIAAALTPDWLQPLTGVTTRKQLAAIARGEVPEGGIGRNAKTALLDQLMADPVLGKMDQISLNGMLESRDIFKADLARFAEQALAFKPLPIVDVQADLNTKGLGRASGGQGLLSLEELQRQHDAQVNGLQRVTKAVETLAEKAEAAGRF